MTLFIAHRGESQDAPENTLASVNLAWERGLASVEVDVRVTRDRVPVVIHNATTGALAGTDWRVSRRSLAELKTLDFGRLRGAAWTGESIATLDDVLDTIPAHGRLFLEIKARSESIQPIRDAIHRSRVRPEQISLIAFRRPLLLKAVRALPDCDACWIVDLKRRRNRDSAKEATRLAGLVKGDGLSAIDVGIDPSCDLSIIARLRSHGLRVYAWTINDRGFARKLIDAGIDGIASDRASALRRELGC